MQQARCFWSMIDKALVMCVSQSSGLGVNERGKERGGGRKSGWEDEGEGGRERGRYRAKAIGVGPESKSIAGEIIAKW